MKNKSNNRLLVIDLFRQGDTLMEMRDTRMMRLNRNPLDRAVESKDRDIKELSIFIGSILFVLVLVVADILTNLGGHAQL